MSLDDQHKVAELVQDFVKFMMFEFKYYLEVVDIFSDMQPPLFYFKKEDEPFYMRKHDFE